MQKKEIYFIMMKNQEGIKAAKGKKQSKAAKGKEQYAQLLLRIG